MAARLTLSTVPTKYWRPLIMTSIYHPVLLFFATPRKTEFSGLTGGFIWKVRSIKISCMPVIFSGLRVKSLHIYWIIIEIYSLIKFGRIPLILSRCSLCLDYSIPYINWLIVTSLFSRDAMSSEPSMRMYCSKIRLECILSNVDLRWMTFSIICL